MLHMSYDLLALVDFCQYSPGLEGGTAACPPRGSLAQHRVATYILTCGPNLGEEVVVAVAVEDQAAIL